LTKSDLSHPNSRFDFLSPAGSLAKKIEKLLEGADEEKKRTIMKIVRAVVL
jgi:hypothetical protein